MEIQYVYLQFNAIDNGIIFKYILHRYLFNRPTPLVLLSTQILFAPVPYVGRNTTTLGSSIFTGTITASYGFGTTANVDTAGLSQGADGRPSDDTVDSTSGSTGAALLLAPDDSDSTNTAVAAAWNETSSNTAGAWHFGSTTDIPVLRYADYDGDGDGDTYGYGSDSTATIVIPDSVPDGAGGTIDIACGTTLLPGQ